MQFDKINLKKLTGKLDYQKEHFTNVKLHEK